MPVWKIKIHQWFQLLISENTNKNALTSLTGHGITITRLGPRTRLGDNLCDKCKHDDLKITTRIWINKWLLTYHHFLVHHLNQKQCILFMLLSSLSVIPLISHLQVFWFYFKYLQVSSLRVMSPNDRHSIDNVSDLRTLMLLR